MTQKCKATGRGCGTPTGWRNGGRCVNCRRAHNRETNQYRGIDAEQRAEVLRLLRAGRTAEHAAAAIDKTPASLANAARRDSELRLALDGEPPERQLAARKGDYLAALTRNGGNRAAAARELGMPPETARFWVRDSEAFAAAEAAVLEWLHQDEAPRPRTAITKAMLDKAADLMEDGATMVQAAAAVGLVDQGALRRHAKNHPRLAALLPSVRQGIYRRTTTDIARKKVRLRELWGTPGVTTAQIAAELQVSASTVRNWRRDLKLPPQKGGRPVAP